MRILLLAMPDACHNFFRVMKVPHLGLCSIAGSLPGHQVRIVDLVLVHRGIRSWLQDYLKDFRPELIGISSMSFQYQSAQEVMRICRAYNPQIPIVLGGYHATLLQEQVTARDDKFDFLVKGEGEQVFPAVVDALMQGNDDFSSIRGLSWRTKTGFVHNAAADNLDLKRLPFPDRSVRVLNGFSYFQKKLDCIETSRGCTHTCSFCSISGMYGRSFRTYDIERVLEDLAFLKRDRVQTVLISDDNITLNVDRFKALCEAIAYKGLNTLEYIVQASVAGIAADPQVARLMAQANFRLVFLGIESLLERNLRLLGKGHVQEQTEQAMQSLRSNGISVMGGFIVGNPGDSRDDVKSVFRGARRLKVDLATVQCVTPYPGTVIRDELLKQGCVTNPDNLTRYTGFICNVKTKHLTNKQLNRLMNWENLKLFFDPRWIRHSTFARNRERGMVKVLLNNLEFVRGWFTGNQFRSRHKF